MSDIEQEQWKALASRCEGWKELAGCLDQLLVCCRAGKHPTDKLLDRIRELRERLGS